MLGPLPPLHRWVVCALALLACIGLGAWLAFTLPVPFIATAGVGIGAALGCVVVMMLLHDGDGHPPTTRGRHLR